MKNKKAFTLVELLIAIGIMGVMTAIMLVSASSSSKELNSLKVEARNVSSTLRQLQNDALAGKNASSTGVACSYIFSGTGSSSNYSATSGCGAVAVNYALKSGIKFSSGGASVVFTNPYATVVTSPIQLIKGSSKYYICVNTSGTIVEQAGPCS